MKKLIIALTMFMSISFAVNAQAPVKKEKKEQTKVELKDHVCTDACKTAGTCVLAHGKKGHECTDACKKEATSMKKTEMKDHVCTAECKDEKHIYAHGEKGHVCTEACKKEM